MTERELRRIPSPGPRPYGDDLADCFFGRDTEIGMILDRVNGQRLSVLVAESASGKTSLLQAGVMPALRKKRLEELAGAIAPLSQFPLLLNQWLGRAAGAGRTSFARLLTCEIDRHLKTSMAWYERQPSGDERLCNAAAQELATIAAARSAVQETALRLSLAFVDDARDELLPLDSESQSRDDDHAMIRHVLTVLAALTDHFGAVLLILDQFEEVLGDPTIGRQAIIAVEATFDNYRQNVRQFLSLRNDSIHLLEPLEKKSILEGKRRVSIAKLAPPAVNSIVGKMSEVATLPWVASADRERLVGTFTSQRPPKDVNLLGLQVVLADLFTQLIQRDATAIGSDDLREYCTTLKMPDGHLDLWLDAHVDSNDNARNGELAEVAPREWIERCLDGRLDGGVLPKEPSDIWLGQIKPMVMRMADWLVTPAGFKRPMTLGELEKIAFRADVQKNRKMAGAATTWTLSRLEAVLEQTCKAALGRLVHGHVLKERGGASDKTYELVHDQFGRPLRQWSETFSQSPAADLASPFAIIDRPFQWTGILRDSVPSGRLADIAWLGCTLQGVDFSGLTLQNCDFSRSVFDRCTFSSDTRLENCRFEGAILVGCTLTGATVVGCNADSIRVAGKTTFEGVTVKGGSMKSATFEQTTLRDCNFSGVSSDALLPMRNLELLNCALKGEVRFQFCALDGATIGGDPEAEAKAETIRVDDVTFIECDLAGAEISNLQFEGSKLELRGGFARGAVFERIVISKSPGDATGCLFDSVVLTGAVFLACALRDAEFRGTASDTGEMTNASTLVFRYLESEDAHLPTILDGVTFQDLDLENFSFLRCAIEGPVEFRNCRASGGTIRGSETDGSHRVRGDLAFNAGCDLAALELNTLDMSGQTLTILQSKAPGIFFANVTITAAHFVLTDMPGAMFMECHLDGAMFSGVENDLALIDTLVIRGGIDSAASLRNCRFDHVNMENFTFESCVIDGDLTFTDSLLSGGTLGNRPQDDGTRSSPMPINGTLTFTAGDLSALEVTNVVFAPGARLISTGSICRGAYFGDSTFPSSETESEPTLVMKDVDLSGSVFVGCVLPNAAFVGGNGTSQLKPAWGLVFRENKVGEVAFSQYDCDGASFEDLDVRQGIRFDECSLLRSKFSGIRIAGTGASLDVRSSDMLYADIEDALLDSADGETGLFAILPEQLAASKAAASWRKQLRLTNRK